jgi:predicted peptidase
MILVYSIIIVLTACVLYMLFFVYRKYYQRDIHGLKYGHYKRTGMSGKLMYRYYLPEFEKGKEYPVIVFLHGSKERGTNNKTQINYASLHWLNAEFQKRYPSIIVMPQCPPKKRWVNTTFPSFPFSNYNQDLIPESNELKLLMALLNDLATNLPIDEKRKYITGFSMGAYGSWDLITRYPSVFAAGIMVAGGADTKKLSRVKHIPTQIFYDKLDHIVPPSVGLDIYNELLNLGANCTITIFENEGHDCIEKALKYEGLMDWLMKQKKTL